MYGTVSGYFLTWNSGRIGQVETVVQPEIDEPEHRGVEL
jgi:hypothetical protein